MSKECKCGFDHWPLPCKQEARIELALQATAVYASPVWPGDPGYDDAPFEVTRIKPAEKSFPPASSST